MSLKYQQQCMKEGMGHMASANVSCACVPQKTTVQCKRIMPKRETLPRSLRERQITDCGTACVRMRLLFEVVKQPVTTTKRTHLPCSVQWTVL